MAPGKRFAILDSLRGLLLILMTIDHLGGPLGTFFFERFGFWSAAEGFFFLSGFVTTRIAFRKEEHAASWICKRAGKVWIWHALSVFAVSSIAVWLGHFGWRDAPGLEALEANPMHLFATLALIHLPDFLDVLPLYVILLLTSSIIIPWVIRKAARVRTALIFWGGSAIVWLLAQFHCWDLLRGGLPAWMHPGVFDPMGWQFIFFSGSSLALVLRSTQLPRPSRLLPWLILPIFFLLWRNGLLPLAVPTDENAWASRNHLGLLRILSFFSLVWIVVLPLRNKASHFTWAFPSLIGRNSLQVFTWHLPLVYLWIYRPRQASLFWEIAVPLLVVLSLAIPAWWREKT